MPLTMEGRILVDSVMASCYGSWNHDLAHVGMLPVQWFPTMIDWVFGEVQAYLNIVEDFSRWVIPYDFRSRIVDL